MCQRDTETMLETLRSRVGNQSYRKTNLSTWRHPSATWRHPSATWRHPSAIISAVLLLLFAALCVLTLQSVWEMRQLENIVSDLELRLLQIEEVCRTRRENLYREDDDDDDTDDDALSTLPADSLEDAVLKLPARLLVDSEMKSPANASHTSAKSLPEAVAIYDGRQKRAAGTGDKKPDEKPKKKGKGKKKALEGRNTAAHFQLDMPGRESEFYQPVKGLILSPWVDSERKRHGTSLSYTFTSSNEGITIAQRGLYFIYTQVTFHNSAPHNIGAIEVNGNTIAQCTQSTHKMKVDDASSGMFANCFTAAVQYLQKDSNVRIASLYRNRQILIRPKNTFFGVIKLA